MSKRDPVDPHSKDLPFYDPAYTWEVFEDFFCDFLNSNPKFPVDVDGKVKEYEVVSASPRNFKGSKQNGIDIVAQIAGGQTWAFECKHKKSWSLQQTKTAIGDCTYSADRYYLLVTCKVHDDVIEHAKAAGWELWDSRRISKEFLARLSREHAARILYLYFGPGWDTKLTDKNGYSPIISADAFFYSSQDAQKYVRHDLPFVGPRTLLDRLDGFVQSKDKHIILLAGRSGTGKTRLLREFSLGFHKRNRGKTLRFVWLQGTQEFEPHFDAVGDSLVVAFDDVHQEAKARRAIFKAARGRDIKFVITTLPGHIESIRQDLYDAGVDPHDLASPEYIEQLSDADTRTLMFSALGRDDPYLIDFLSAAASECPLTGVVGAKILTLSAGKSPRKALTSSAELESRVFETLLGQKDHIAGFSREDIDHFLKYLAVLSPLENSVQARERLAPCVNPHWRSDQLSELISKLKECGLVVEPTSGLRIIPELLSGHVVKKSCFDERGRSRGFAEKVVTECGDEKLLRVIGNIAPAEWEVQPRHEDSIIASLSNKLVACLNVNSWTTRLDVVQTWMSFAGFIPRVTLDFAHAIVALLDSPATDREENYLERFARRALPGKSVSLLVHTAKSSSDVVAQCLDMLWQMGLRNDIEFQSEDDPIAAIGKVLTYENYDASKTQRKALNWVDDFFTRERWKGSRFMPAALLPSFIEPIFTPDIDASIFTDNAFHFRRRLVPSGDAISLHDESLALLSKLRGRESLPLTLAVVQTARRIISGKFISIAPRQDYLDSWMASSFTALDLIKSIVSEPQAPIVLYSIRRAFRPFLNEGGNERIRKVCTEIAGGIPDSFDLRVLETAFYSGAIDFGLEHRSVSWEEANAHLEALVESVALELRVVYSSAESILAYMEDVIASVSDIYERPNFRRLLTVVARQDSELALGLAGVLIRSPASRLSRDIDILVHSATNSANWRRRLELYTEASRSDSTATKAAVLYGLAWWRQASELPEEAWRIAESAGSNSNREIVLATIAFVELNVQGSTERDWQVLSQLQIDSDDSVVVGKYLETISRLLDIGAAEASSVQITEILSKIERRVDANEPGLERCMLGISRKFPGEVFMMLTRLFDIEERENSLMGTPHWIGSASFRGIESNAEAMAKVESLLAKYFGGMQLGNGRQRVLQAVVHRGLTDATSRLTSWIDLAQSEQAMELLLKMLSFPDAHFAVTDPDWARRFLLKAHSLGEHAYQRLRAELVGRCSPSHRSSSNWEPDAEWKWWLEKLEQRAAEFVNDSELASFYRDLANAEREMMDSERNRAKSKLVDPA